MQEWAGPHCSRSARPLKAFVGRAQLRATLATPFDAGKGGMRGRRSAAWQFTVLARRAPSEGPCHTDTVGCNTEPAWDDTKS